MVTAKFHQLRGSWWGSQSLALTLRAHIASQRSEDAASKAEKPEHAELYLRMANEEKKHYNIMENLYDFVLEPSYYLAWREFSNLREL